MASKHLPRRAKTKGGLEKCLANPGSRQKITKTTHAVRGLQTKWEIPAYYVSINSTLAFNKIIATSSQNSFEFDDIAVSGSTQFTPSPTPEPSVTALGLANLLGLAAIRQYRRPQSQRIN